MCWHLPSHQARNHHIIIVTYLIDFQLVLLLWFANLSFLLKSGEESR